MPLTSMKLTPAEQKAEGEGMVADMDRPDYPYGLCLRLDADSMSKLGISEMPALGTVMRVTALAKVTSLSASEYEGSKPYADLGLQITDMDLVPEKKAVDARTMFPKSKMEA